MRLCVFAIVLAAGCSQREAVDLQPWIAVTGHYALIATGDPSVPVTGPCPNCNGEGRVGDGKVFVTCPACDGTGVRPESLVVQPEILISPQGAAAARPCPDGKCNTKR